MKYKEITIVISLALMLGGCSLWPNSEVNRVGPTQSDEDIQPSAPTISEPMEISEGKIALNLLNPENGITISEPKVVVLGQTTAKAEVFVNEHELQADEVGAFSQSIDLVEGENHIVVLVNDRDGNYLEREIVLYYEPETY